MLFIFIYGVGYGLSYMRYNDKKLIDVELVLLENETLKNELNELKELDTKFEIEKVFIRDIHSFYNQVVIKTSDKELIGSAIVNDEGLVGILSKVENGFGYINLLTSDYNVSVKVGDTYGNLSRGEISLLDKYSDIKVGDLVYTSGLNDIPKDIYIGKVIDVTMDNENLGKKVKVELIDNKYLNYVGIVKVS